jgi:hypothetical protein
VAAALCSALMCSITQITSAAAARLSPADSTMKGTDFPWPMP